jgi:transporter family-2 protein
MVSSVWILALGAILVGALMATQSVMNSALGRSVGLIVPVFLTSLTASAITLGVLLFGGGGPRATSADFVQSPPYLWLGGAMSVLILGGVVFLVPRMGLAAFMALAVAGQLIVSMLWDQVGLFGLQQIPITTVRVIGAALLVVGARLVLWR